MFPSQSNILFAFDFTERLQQLAVVCVIYTISLDAKDEGMDSWIILLKREKAPNQMSFPLSLCKILELQTGATICLYNVHSKLRIY